MEGWLEVVGVVSAFDVYVAAGLFFPPAQPAGVGPSASAPGALKCNPNVVVPCRALDSQSPSTFSCTKLPLGRPGRICRLCPAQPM
eukprot:8991999-Pyramimonas_sp.AAC.2